MEWKNYNEISPDQRILVNKNYLNLDENLDLNHPYSNQENDQEYQLLTDNDFKVNNQDVNDKMNYYFLLNDMDPNEYNFISKYDMFRPSISFSNQKNNIDLPFMNEQEEEEEKKVNKLSSESSNNENKEQIKKNLFKIQSLPYAKKDIEQNLIKSKESLTEENDEKNNNNSFQTMSLKERMKIKKQKTKKLLENKTQRSTIHEESKENNYEKNNSVSLNNSQENILGVISNNNSSSYSINNNNNLNNTNINNIKPNVLSKMSKKEIKMLRNRLSAQRSRDRKKKELIDLKSIAKSLLEENEKLRNEIKERDDKINKLFNLLCPECHEKIKMNNFEITVEKNIDSIKSTAGCEMELTPSTIAAGKKKLALLMTGLFTIFCLFAVFISPPNEQNILRNLKEKNNSENKVNEYNGEKRVNVPFIIEKDYTIRHKKEIEMYQKIQKNNLKNKNLMVPASLFKNNSEQIISNINNSINNITQNNNISDNDKNNMNKNNTSENTKDHDEKNIININIGFKQNNSKRKDIIKEKLIEDN
mgnify:FL=1